MKDVDRLLGGQALLMREFMPPAECDEHINFSEELGFEEAPIDAGGAAVVVREYRSNSRVILDDPALAARLFLRLRDTLPPRVGDRSLSGLNERFRYYRYDPGESFAPHFDGPFRRSDDEESALTFMVYLNDDFEGGNTDFYHPDHSLRLSVRPEQGMALVFHHPILHAGTAVRSGRKYVLRTDVMYARRRFSL